MDEHLAEMRSPFDLLKNSLILACEPVGQVARFSEDSLRTAYVNWSDIRCL